MCLTQVPDYKRTKISNGVLSSDGNSMNVLGEAKNFFNESYSFENQKVPGQGALRQNTPNAINSELALGGDLRNDTKDLITQQALNGTSASGVINSFNGRGLVAKDIGITSEDLRQKRVSNATTYMANNPLEYIGLTAGQMGSIFVDDKVRDFQNKKDKAAAQQSDLSSLISIGAGVLTALI